MLKLNVQFHKTFQSIGLAFVSLLVTAVAAAPPQPLHERIDAHIHSAHAGAEIPLTTDEEFLRRVHLDLTGLIPSSEELRTFLVDDDPQKRNKTINRLLASPQHVRHLQIRFDVMLMERRNAKQIKNPEWREYLYQSFRERKPYNQLAMEILRADARNGPLRPATKFYLDRDGEASVLTRDVGRLFFGLDLECAQCHDHPSIDDYLQEDYYSLFAFLGRSYTVEDKRSSLQLMAERAEGEASFKSAFTEVEGQSLPRLPEGVAELVDPKFHAGLYKQRPGEGLPGVPTYSRRERLAMETGAGTNPAFARNIANRLWAMMMGRGLVHPPDLHHSDNPATHPALLAELAESLAEMKYNVSRFLGELARSRTYQRSGETPVLTVDAKRAGKLLAAREKSVETQRGAVQKARSAWRDGNARLQEAVDALAGTDYSEVITAAVQAKDNAYQAISAVIQQQRSIVEKETATKLAREAADLAEAAATKVTNQIEKLNEAAKDLRERAKKLGGETDKEREQLPALEKMIRTAEAALPAAYERAEAIAATSRDLVTRVEEERSSIDAAKRSFQTAQKMLEQSRYAMAENKLLLQVINLAANQNKAQETFAPVAERHETLRAESSKLRAEMLKAETALAGARREVSEAETVTTKTRAELAPKKEAAKLIDAAQKQVYAALEKLPDDKTLTATLKTLETEGQTTGKSIEALEKTLGETNDRSKKANETINSSQEALAKAKPTREKARAELESFADEFNALKAEADAATIASTEAHTELLDLWRQRFAMASLKPLSPEQLGWSAMRALGLVDRRLQQEIEGNKHKDDKIQISFDAERATHNNLRGQVDVFIRLYRGPPGSDEREFQATAQQALFMMNSNEVQNLLKPSDGNLTQRLLKLEPAAMAEELYLSVLSRRPTEDETETIVAYLQPLEKAPEGQAKTAPQSEDFRKTAVQDLIWALLTSAEFRFNR